MGEGVGWDGDRVAGGGHVCVRACARARACVCVCVQTWLRLSSPSVKISRCLCSACRPSSLPIGCACNAVDATRRHRLDSATGPVRRSLVRPECMAAASVRLWSQSDGPVGKARHASCARYRLSRELGVGWVGAG